MVRRQNPHALLIGDIIVLKYDYNNRAHIPNYMEGMSVTIVDISTSGVPQIFYKRTRYVKPNNVAEVIRKDGRGLNGTNHFGSKN